MAYLKCSTVPPGRKMARNKRLRITAVVRRKFHILVTILVTAFVVSVFKRCDHKRLYTWKSPPDAEEAHERIGITWDLAWFFSSGYYKPDAESSTAADSIWPSNNSDDRIVTQLMYVPEVQEGRPKTIYLTHSSYFPFKGAVNEFMDGHCPVWNCLITESMKNADAVVFKDIIRANRKLVPTSQIWILFLLESPFNTAKRFQKNVINWTASYRTDSEIVTPYSKWVYYDEKVKSRYLGINFASGKRHKVAWIVSNCRAKNRRLEYARELQKYISVDIFGACGTMSCPRREIFDCHDMLSKHYKFYLSFENGNCVDYITEKFFHNGLQSDVIPIVMGARREDYRKVAPVHSYIHVEDFEDAKSLAEYLHVLDKNDTLYNSYFLWKGTGEFVNTHFFCRLCAMLNGNPPVRFYRNFTHWWNKPGTCVKDRWDRVT